MTIKIRGYIDGRRPKFWVAFDDIHGHRWDSHAIEIPVGRDWMGASNWVIGIRGRTPFEALYRFQRLIQKERHGR
jgi:hypothetical protein